MKKIGILILLLIGITWLAGEFKNMLLFFQQSSQVSTAMTTATTGETPSFSLQSLHRKWESGKPFMLQENELTSLLQQLFSQEITNSSQMTTIPLKGTLETRITTEGIQITLPIETNAFIQIVSSHELRQLLRPWLNRLHQTTVPLTIRFRPQVYAGRIVYTEGLQIQVAQLPIDLGELKPQLQQLLQQLIQTGVLPARARDIQLQDGQLLIMP